MTGQLELIEHSAPTDLGAFHGDPKVKAFYLKRLEDHAAADELVQGVYWENGRGCAVGCVVHGSRHKTYAATLNIPEELVRLQDRVFETLPPAVAKGFPIRFLSAIEPGADLSTVVPQFTVWTLTDQDHGVARLVSTDRVRKAIDVVAVLHTRRLAGDEPTEHEWGVARRAVNVAGGDLASDVTMRAVTVACRSTCITGQAGVLATVFSAARYTATHDPRRTTYGDYAALVADKLVELLAATAS